jgi:protease I
MENSMFSHDLVDRYQAIPIALKDTLRGENYMLPQFEGQGLASLKRFRVALVTSHGAELPEFHVPLHYLLDRGASVEIVTQDWLFDSQKEEACGMVVLAQFLAADVCVRAHKKISDAKAQDYDAVVILGGAWNPIMLRTDEEIVRFVREAHKRGILIAAICHGPQVLISTDVFPGGTRATGVRDIRGDLTNACFVVEDRPVVYDETQHLITSPNPTPEALKAFCEEIAKQLMSDKSRNNIGYFKVGHTADEKAEMSDKPRSNVGPSNKEAAALDEDKRTATFKRIQWVAVFVGLASVQAALLYKLIAGQSAPNPAEMIAAICVVGILLVLASNVDRMESLSLTKKGFGLKLAQLEQKTNENAAAVERLILESMGPDAYKNLTKFARPQGFEEYEKRHHEGLESELYHLRNLGYVKLRENLSLPNGTALKSIYDIPPRGTQLSDYIEITNDGRKYIELREKS